MAADEAQRPLGDSGGNDSPFTPEFRRLAQEMMDKWHVPGLAVAVVDAGKVDAEGFGTSSFAKNTPVTPSTLFMTGSTTKAFTDAALGLLIDSGNFTLPPPPGGDSNNAPAPLSWRTPISAILPEDFIMADPWATTHLTLEDAASHRTGLPSHDYALARVYGTGASRRNATIRDVVRTLRYLPLNREPRVEYQYNNFMYIVLTHCVETLLGGKWLGDVLRERIWEPLGMQQTYFSLEAAQAAPEELAAPYQWVDEEEEMGDKGGGGRFLELAPMTLNEVGGAGATVSTVKDYARWLQCLLEEGAPLSKKAHEALREPKISTGEGKGIFDTTLSYASGWDVGSYKGHRVVKHNGGLKAYGTEVSFFPDDGFGVVTMGNTAGTANTVGAILVWHLVDEKLGIPREERYPWNKRFEDGARQAQHNIDHAIETLFPDFKGEPLPPALPLEKYTGTYYHPGYKNVTIELAEEVDGNDNKIKLVADHLDFTWQLLLEFEHISCEHWIMWAKRAGTELPKGLKPIQYAAVEFRAGVDKQAGRLGIEWSNTNSETGNGWIWYDRVV
ncbi:beta-lactamase/transpeptidase-like protein [Bombardia bombarda]|uniref:Beta-lactamase/transpeptidase-like protein n=1 Tax=Bombardia bombarda TaxID=252184 RepID=A0AA40C994_9PEZI|nr:beta-lactamase/transpeptidase-like protein [Bombardia bombarda]